MNICTGSEFLAFERFLYLSRVVLEPLLLFAKYVYSHVIISMSNGWNQWLNQCNQWLIDAIDDLSMTKNFVTHRLVIDYSLTSLMSLMSSISYVWLNAQPEKRATSSEYFLSYEKAKLMRVEDNNLALLKQNIVKFKI